MPDRNSPLSHGGYSLLRLFAYSLLITVFLPLPSQASSPSDVRPALIQRPSTEDLTRIIVTSNSVISEKTQQAIAEYLEKIDKQHLSYAHMNKVEVLVEGDASSQISETTLPIPNLTPLSEKTITYLMFLQIEMLDRVLSTRDRETADALRKQRASVRLLRPEQRVFGDARDFVVASIVKALSDINKLHVALDVPSKLEISYPTRIKTLAEIEKFILVKASAVLANAQQLVDEE